MTEYELKNKEVKRKKEGKSDKRAERQGKDDSNKNYSED